ncbi:MAG: hypothetical protein NVS1B7_7110 [Candidatus Saccharimonadales bacterium]
MLLYGYPGAGKTYFARQLCEDLKAAHVQGDRIRFELFEEPRYDQQENEIVEHLMGYMTEEFLNAGISVVYDMNAARLTKRRELRDMARKVKAKPLLVWFQLDAETAYLRAVKRDRRTADDKYAMPIDRASFARFTSIMQNPTTIEDYMVISGKHNYNTQRGAIIKKLYDLGLISADIASSKLVKPELVNLIPNRVIGRVDPTRRNIHIH